MANSTLVEDAIAKAIAKAQAEAVQQAKSEAEARASKIELWKQQISDREASERQSKNKTGMAIAEEFLEECSEPFSRLMARNDADKLSNLTISLRLGKSDASPSYSMVLECPGISPRIWHRSSIDKMVDLHQAKISRLQSQAEFRGSSPVEMLEEIVRLRGYLARIERVVENAQTDEASKVRDILAPLQPSKEASVTESN